MAEPSVLRRMLVLVFLKVSMHMTGNIIIVTYIVPIFQASGSSINSYLSAILVGIMRVVGVVIFLFIVERLKRIRAFIASCIVCAGTLISLGVYFKIKNDEAYVSNIYSLPVTSLILYSPFIAMIQSYLTLFRGEIFPTSIRALAVAILYAVFFLAMFATTLVFPLMLGTLGEHGTFWIFAGNCLLMAVVVGLMLTETKGLSLEEIDQVFRQGKWYFIGSEKDSLSMVNTP